jgi:hypothetical protein
MDWDIHHGLSVYRSNIIIAATVNLDIGPAAGQSQFSCVVSMPLILWPTICHAKDMLQTYYTSIQSPRQHTCAVKPEYAYVKHNVFECREGSYRRAACHVMRSQRWTNATPLSLHVPVESFLVPLDSFHWYDNALGSYRVTMHTRNSRINKPCSSEWNSHI